MAFLPINKAEMNSFGWDQADIIYVTGDAYVDHSSFGPAVITRLLESKGFKVGIISQPNWRSVDDIKKLGRPRLGFLVSSGNMDSMVNHYTANKQPRSKDLFSPGGKKGLRPNRAVIVYCNLIRQAFGDIPIVIGGIEASLRRFAHYDYWEDKVRQSVLLDCGADLLVYGMSENRVVEVFNMLEKGIPISRMHFVRGTCYACHPDLLPKEISEVINNGELGPNEADKRFGASIVVIPSFDDVSSDKKKFASAFLFQYKEQDPINGGTIVQPHPKKVLVQNPPELPLSQEKMDAIYSLPYENKWHPTYDADGGIPAFDEVVFSITSHRGCFGGCSFCALNFHQGRIIQSRSHNSIIEEAKKMIERPNFKGNIHDVGGPTANFRIPACKQQATQGACKHRQCMFPEPCKNLDVDYSDYLSLLNKIKLLKGVKKVFVRSGLRFDHMLLDKKNTLLNEICTHHVSGQLRVAPEHIDEDVLNLMGKSGKKTYDTFSSLFNETNKRLKKEQFLVPYLIASHPGSTLKSAIKLAEYLKKNQIHPDQVQDFYPTPSTLSTCMYYTSLDPRTMKKVYVPRSNEERAMQRALLQFSNPNNSGMLIKALEKAGRHDLIGYGPNALIRPPKEKNNSHNAKKKIYSKKNK